VEFLGYTDSGMMGEASNDGDGTFWTASVEEAAEKLAAILREENADVLTVYDDHGGYGHPDHIQVHRVGVRAAELAGTERVYQATINRDHVIAGRQQFAEVSGIEMPELGEDFGTAADKITCAVDVTEFAQHKRKAMRAHASQISDQSFFLALPDEAFRLAFGIEWFIRDGAGPGITETDLMAGLD
jgi:LmbE family N-acetylglucosaminyl deacetylase